MADLEVGGPEGEVAVSLLFVASDKMWNLRTLTNVCQWPRFMLKTPKKGRKLPTAMALARQSRVELALETAGLLHPNHACELPLLY